MSRAKGDLAETRAAEYLRTQGFEIIERNYHSRFGEIDIVAFKAQTLHFVEVKSGAGDPIERITPQKLSRILKTVQIYLAHRRYAGDYCIDAMSVGDTIDLIENITL